MTKHIITALLVSLACSKGSPAPIRPTQLVAVPATRTTGFKLDLGTCTDAAALIAVEQANEDRVAVPADSAAARAATPKLALAIERPAPLALASNSCSL